MSLSLEDLTQVTPLQHSSILKIPRKVQRSPPASLALFGRAIQAPPRVTPTSARLTLIPAHRNQHSPHQTQEYPRKIQLSPRRIQGTPREIQSPPRDIHPK